MNKLKTIFAIILILASLTSEAKKKHKRKKVYTKCNGTCVAYK